QAVVAGEAAPGSLERLAVLAHLLEQARLAGALLLGRARAAVEGVEAVAVLEHEREHLPAPLGRRLVRRALRGRPVSGQPAAHTLLLDRDRERLVEHRVVPD